MFKFFNKSPNILPIVAPNDSSFEILIFVGINSSSFLYLTVLYHLIHYLYIVFLKFRTKAIKPLYIFNIQLNIFFNISIIHFIHIDIYFLSPFTLNFHIHKVISSFVKFYQFLKILRIPIFQDFFDVVMKHTPHVLYRGYN